jgi:NOL1/NOP2/fmu family ribosome biogenesis protein
MPKKKRPIEEKHPIELTDDEAMEWMFGKEARDKLKGAAHKARKPDTYVKKSLHK